jgi:hypothetical protein
MTLYKGYDSYVGRVPDISGFQTKEGLSMDRPSLQFHTHYLLTYLSIFLSPSEVKDSMRNYHPQHHSRHIYG